MSWMEDAHSLLLLNKAAFIDSCQTVAKTASALSPNSPGKSPYTSHSCLMGDQDLNLLTQDHIANKWQK